MGYIYMRHWDYWYNVYQIGDFEKVDANGVEFNISDQEGRGDEFFHFDFYTLTALTRMIEDNDFIENCDSEYPEFIENYEALKSGKIEFFIGALHYQRFYPGLTDCNNAFIGDKSILEYKSPSYQPYYAVIFIKEKQPLMPELLVKWTTKVCRGLFKEAFDFQIADIPTFQQTLESYRSDGRFL